MKLTKIISLSSASLMLLLGGIATLNTVNMAPVATVHAATWSYKGEPLQINGKYDEENNDLVVNTQEWLNKTKVWGNKRIPYNLHGKNTITYN